MYVTETLQHKVETEITEEEYNRLQSEDDEQRLSMTIGDYTSDSTIDDGEYDEGHIEKINE
jgi:hypothetical protein